MSTTWVRLRLSKTSEKSLRPSWIFLVERFRDSAGSSVLRVAQGCKHPILLLFDLGKLRQGRVRCLLSSHTFVLQGPWSSEAVYSSNASWLKPAHVFSTPPQTTNIKLALLKSSVLMHEVVPQKVLSRTDHDGKPQVCCSKIPHVQDCFGNIPLFPSFPLSQYIHPNLTLHSLDGANHQLHQQPHPGVP